MKKGMDPLSTSRAFTLVELLVSLTVVALLAAMAIPAIQSALDRADRVVCLSNLRQLGQAMAEYVSDHGHYPAAEIEVTDSAGTVVERKRWYHLLAPYLDTGPRAGSSGQGRARIDPESGRAGEIVLPSDDDADQEAFSSVLRCPKVSHWEVGRNGAYGYNHQYFGDARPVGRNAEGTLLRRHYPIRPSQIADRSRTVVLVDSAGTGEGPYRTTRRPNADAIGNHAFTVDPPVIPTRGGTTRDGTELPPTRWGSDSDVPGVGEPTRPSRPHARHRGGVCVLFADGRTEWVPLDRLVATDAWWNGTGVPSEP